MNSQEFTSRSEEDTLTIASDFAKTLTSPSLIAFYGDLAAGKTTFIKGLVNYYAQNEKSLVFSPTFVYLNHYALKPSIFHFDLYRLKGPKDFIAMGFEEYLFADAIVCVEWAERIDEILPRETIKIDMRHLSDHERILSICG